jgi:hypoxanthine phosphoribosyltransferase
MNYSTTPIEGRIKVKDKYFTRYIESGRILAAVKNIAERIYDDHGDEMPLFLSVLNGSFMFTSDLMKVYPGVCELSFIRVSSYSGTKTTGEVKTSIGLTHDITSRTVILLEDIIDSGITVKHLLQDLMAMNPSAVKVATLLLKPEALQTDVKPDYTGIEIPKDFIVGYGLDYDGFGRNLPDIYKIIE